MFNKSSKFKVKNSKFWRRFLKEKISQSGQSLLELVVVITVIVIVVSALVFATIASLRNATFARNQAQATKLAQEALERVRIGRDRNQAIMSLSLSVISWDGDTAGAKKIWDYPIDGNCSDVKLLPVPKYCFFNVTSDGILNHLIAYIQIPGQPVLPINSESVGQFKRAVSLYDDTDAPDVTYQNQKTVTVIVTWTDFSGSHESRLTTILRKK